MLWLVSIVFGMLWLLVRRWDVVLTFQDLLLAAVLGAQVWIVILNYQAENQ
jgi:hypothetical protein